MCTTTYHGVLLMSSMLKHKTSSCILNLTLFVLLLRRQAVQQFGGTTTNMFEISESDSDNRNGGIIFGTPGVWARIHTIYYRPGAALRCFV